MMDFEILKLAQQAIPFGIRNYRVIKDVIAVIGLFKLRLQLQHPLPEKIHISVRA
jgi:hypothetical protein